MAALPDNRAPNSAAASATQRVAHSASTRSVPDTATTASAWPSRSPSPVPITSDKVKAIQARVLPAQSHAHRTVIAAWCALAGSVTRESNTARRKISPTTATPAISWTNCVTGRPMAVNAPIGQSQRRREVAGAGPPSGDDNGPEPGEEEGRQHGYGARCMSHRRLAFDAWGEFDHDGQLRVDTGKRLEFCGKSSATSSVIVPARVTGFSSGRWSRSAAPAGPRYRQCESGRTPANQWTVSYTHLRAHETVLDLVC